MARCIKTLGQRSVVIYKDIASASAITISVFKGVAMTAGAVVTLTGGEVSSFVADDKIELLISRLVPTNLTDDFYSLTITVDAVADNTAGFGYTATATNRLYSKVAALDPRGPDYRIAQTLHTAKMMLDEMNALEDVNVSQRVYQFDKRNTILKEILGYD